MFVRALFTLLVIFLVYKAFQRLFLQKRCTACARMIDRQAAICHYCNTIQDGIEIAPVQVAAGGAAGSNGSGRAGRNRMLWYLITLMMLVVVCVAVAVWWMQSG